MVRALISEHRANVDARDFQNDTPLHKCCTRWSVRHNQNAFSEEFGCDPNIRGYSGRTLVHHACRKGHLHVVNMLVKECGSYLLFLVDNDGNTVLHLASVFGHMHLVEHLLLHYKPPAFVRNRNGNSPMDVSKKPEIRKIFQSCFSENRTMIEEEYKKLQSLSKQKFAQSSTTKVFVIGQCGAGKSTLIKALKIEGFFGSLRNQTLTESVVPPHTAGIIPSIHKSSKFGTVLFCDFAGDAEYYSSHAAVLERMMGSGCNIFLLVTDLSKIITTIEDELSFWLSFVSFHSKSSTNSSRILVIGSHMDVVKSSGGNPQSILQIIDDTASAFCKSTSTLIFDGSFSLDCCHPSNVKQQKLPEKLSLLYEQSPLHCFSAGASILIGLLERDFKEVITCQIQIVIDHINATGVHLPSSPSDLTVLLLELQNYSLLLTAGKIIEPENLWIILNVSKLTQEVHKKLFSKDAMETLSQQRNPNIQNMLKLGIIPGTLLQEICPLYMSKECLVQLQYCQEIPQADVHHNYLIKPTRQLHSESHESEHTSSTLLFFPALLQLKKESIEWAVREELPCSLGWYGTCYRQFDYLPPRFLHVLLLRLAFCTELTGSQTLSLSCDHSGADCEEERSALGADCHLWKWGIRMSTELGVEFLVEVVNNGVVVVCRSDKECEVHCCSIFSAIIQKVLEAKAEFCHSVTLKSYLIDPDELSHIQLSSLDVSQLSLYAMSDVKRVLMEDKPSVKSSDGYGSKMLPAKKLCYFKNYTMWSKSLE